MTTALARAGQVPGPYPLVDSVPLGFYLLPIASPPSSHHRPSSPLLQLQLHLSLQTLDRFPSCPPGAGASGDLRVHHLPQPCLSFEMVSTCLGFPAFQTPHLLRQCDLSLALPAPLAQRLDAVPARPSVQRLHYRSQITVLYGFQSHRSSADRLSLQLANTYSAPLPRRP